MTSSFPWLHNNQVPLTSSFDRQRAWDFQASCDPSQTHWKKKWRNQDADPRGLSNHIVLSCEHTQLCLSSRPQWWWFIFTIKLTGFRITWESYHRVRVSRKVWLRRKHPLWVWAAPSRGQGSQDDRKRRELNPACIPLCFLIADICAPASHLPTSRLSHRGLRPLKPRAKINPRFLNWLLSGT